MALTPEQQKAIEAYRKARENMTDEQRREEDFELRANFEPGTVIVDVITGKKRKV
jgi:hypothetical protein